MLNAINSHSMKTKIYFLAILFFNASVIFAQAPNWAWAKSAGGTYSDFGLSNTMDANGNLYATGRFGNSNITFGSITLSSSGQNDIFIVKYNSGGNVLWAKAIGGADDEQGSCIAVDANGNLYITGYFESATLIFGSITLSNANASGGSGDIFIAKYDSLGNAIWAKSAGSTNYNDYSNGVTVDRDGNPIITGYFQSLAITFDNFNLTNSGIGNIFVTKYDSSGNTLWAISANGAPDVSGYSIASDTNGNIYVTGMFDSPNVIFNNITLVNTNIVDGTADFFIAKIDSTGNIIWAKSAGGFATEYSYSIKVDLDGNTYIAGYFQSLNINFVGATLTNSDTTNNTYDVFVAKYDSLGNIIWANSALGIDSDFGIGLTLNNSRNSYITGAFYSATIAFDSYVLTNSGGRDIFIVKYDTSGNVSWAKAVGGTFNDESVGITTDSINSLYITGYFASSSISLGMTTLTNSGGFDVLTAKLDNTTGTFTPFASSNTINIFPNPASGPITITSPDIITEIKITNTLGQLIYQAKPNEKNVLVRLLNEGLFFVAVTTHEKTDTRKIIVVE